MNAVITLELLTISGYLIVAFFPDVVLSLNIDWIWQLGFCEFEFRHWLGRRGDQTKMIWFAMNRLFKCGEHLRE
jgi:hypothetical protein